ncbi:MAG: cytochrome b [Gammaproteobacteria bacterium]|nr:MAG: cytochrome b [Gammaproteobacteria bacterium]
MLTNGPDRYGVVSRALHWFTALLFFGMLVLGLTMASLDDADPLKAQLLFYHQSTGLLIFVLTLARLGWLAFSPPPPLPETLQQWEILLAQAVRILMYLLLLAVPVAGYLTLAYDGQDVRFFGLFPVPALVGQDAVLHEVFEEVHEVLVWTLFLLVVLHIAGAVKHRLELGPGVDVLRRMV